MSLNKQAETAKQGGNKRCVKTSERLTRRQQERAYMQAAIELNM
jgi:hypothetical protein